MERPIEELGVGAQLPDSEWPAFRDDLAEAIAGMILSGGLPVTETPRRPRREPRLVVDVVETGEEQVDE